MNIAITGHRPNKLGNDYALVSPLIQKIEGMIEVYLLSKDILRIDTDPDTIKRIRHTGVDVTFITGMALGIDTLFAQIAIKYGIPFIAAIPFKGQESKWPQASRKLYYELLSKAATIYIVDEDRTAEFEEFKIYRLENRYSPDKMQKRNIWMVDKCDSLIAVWDKSSGGTANCVRYAETIGRDCIHINPTDLSMNHIKPLVT